MLPGREAAGASRDERRSVESSGQHVLTCLPVHRCVRRCRRRLTRPAGRGCAALRSLTSPRPSTRSRIFARRSSGRHRLEARAALIAAVAFHDRHQQRFPNLAGAMIREALTHKAVIELRQNPPSPSPLPSAKGLPAGAPLPEVTRQRLYPPRKPSTPTARTTAPPCIRAYRRHRGVPRVIKEQQPVQVARYLASHDLCDTIDHTLVPRWAMSDTLNAMKVHQ